MNGWKKRSCCKCGRMVKCRLLAHGCPKLKIPDRWICWACLRKLRTSRIGEQGGDY